jgi:hypothetical protein
MARLSTRSFPCYCGNSVLRSAAVKKGKKLCLAAILNLRNARAHFIMVKTHPVRNSQFMKAIRDVHAFFREESFKIRNNQPVLPHTAITERVCAWLKVSSSFYNFTSE